MEESGHDIVEVLSQYLPGGSEETYEEPQSR
jgi:hypothetical protein